MPAAKKQRLKTYQTRIGLHTWVVAAPNQKAALQAWDVHADLFAKGDAAITEDRTAIKAALSTPGKPVALELDAKTKSELNVIGREIAKPEPKHHTHSRPKPKQQIKPDRTKLEAAEKQAAAFYAKAERLRASMARKRKKLLASLEAEEELLDAQERRQKSKLSQAQRDFESRAR